MPTGYTAAVADGKITTLREFALQCARGMGACAMMRDDPWDKPIPERFEPSRWNADKLAEAEAAMADLDGLSRAECEARAVAHHAEKVASFNRYRDEKEAQRARYVAMRDQVLAWQTEAEGIREFMLEQLASSIDFDCRPVDPADPFIGIPAPMTGEEWRAWAVAEATKEIAYHAEENAKEIARTESRNRWLAALRASLPTDQVPA